MPTFRSTRYRPLNPTSSYQTSLPAWYRRHLPHHPILLFGLPFLATIVGASFLLTPATAIRYERHDRKVRQVTKEEELGLGQERRRVSGLERRREEYYRLAAKDLDEWEVKRVKRLEGEPDGVL